MRLDAAAMKSLNIGFNGAFKRGWESASPIWDQIMMRVNSSTSGEAYAWLKQLPSVREWLGDRVIHGLTKDGFKIMNRTFESTVRMKRTDLEDDNIGAYAPMLSELGRRGAEFPDELFAELIASGFTTDCYDGQNFFDTDHPVENDGQTVSVSNYQAGAGAAWYLLDLSREIRPFIYQERMPFKLQSLDRDSDDNVFMKDEYLYGIRGRCNVGFGLWQLAFGSKATLNAENYAAARAAMAAFRGDNNRKLGIRGTHLLVPSSLEGAGRKLLKNQAGTGGESNEWFESAELIISHWL